MADDLKDRIRARKAARMASQPAPTEAPQGLAPVPATAAPAAEKPGVLGSFIRGAGQGAMFGFQDELVGGVRALTEPLRARLAGVDPSFIPSAGEAYKESRDDYRGVLAEDFEENPWATGGGMLAGGLAVPGGAIKAAGLGGKVLAGAGIGAASGALQGAGDAPEMGDIPESAIKGAAIGGVLGGALPAVAGGVGAIRRAAPKVRDAVVAGADKVVDLAEQNPMGRVAVNVASAGVGAPGAPEAAIGVAKGIRKMGKATPKAPPVEPFSMPGAGDEDALAAAIRNADAEQQLARMKAGMTEATTSPVPEMGTQQIDAGDILKESSLPPPIPKPPTPKTGEWLPTDDVDDEIERLMGGRGPNHPDVKAGREFAARFKGAKEPQPLPERAPRPPAGDPLADAQAALEGPPFQEVTSTVPRFNTGEIDQVRQDYRAELKTPVPPARQPKAGPKGLDFPEPAAGPESVRPMVGKPDPLEVAQASAFDLPPPAEPTTGQIRGRSPAPPQPRQPLPAVQGVSRPSPMDPAKFDEFMREQMLGGPGQRKGDVIMPSSASSDLPPVGEKTFERDVGELLGAAGPDSQVWSESARLRAGFERGPAQPGTKRAAQEAARKHLAGSPKPPADPWDEFYRADFASVKDINTPEAYGQALQKAKMSGLPREKAAKYAKEAGWPPEVMQWAGLADEAPAAPKPSAIRKKKPKP